MQESRLVVNSKQVNCDRVSISLAEAVLATEQARVVAQALNVTEQQAALEQMSSAVLLNSDQLRLYKNALQVCLEVREQRVAACEQELVYQQDRVSRSLNSFQAHTRGLSVEFNPHMADQCYPETNGSETRGSDSANRSSIPENHSVEYHETDLIMPRSPEYSLTHDRAHSTNSPRPDVNSVENETFSNA